MPPKNQDSPKDSSPKTNDTNNKGDNNDKAASDDNDSKDDSTQVADPVKAFREDMEMEGFSGKELFIRLHSAKIILFVFTQILREIKIYHLWKQPEASFVNL